MTAADNNRLAIDMVREVINSLRDEVLDLLAELVGINTYSYNDSGLARAVEVVDLAVPEVLQPFLPTGEDKPGLRIYEHLSGGAAPILMVGHLDTVFPPGQFDAPMTADGLFLKGPGIADMKGGLAVMLGAVRVLDRLGHLPELSIIMAINTDEEIGSINSTPVLKKLAARSRYGLVFECGGPGGAVVTSRRGLRRYTLEIKGAGGHAGFQEKGKQSTLVEMAHQILRLEALNKPKHGISVNVGRVTGGTAANVVPAWAQADLELRYWDTEMGNSAAERIMASLASPVISGLDIKITRTHTRSAMLKTKNSIALFKRAAATGKRLGQSIKEEARPGASDANTLSAAHLPTLDGLGPVGEMDHSTQERIYKESIFERIELVTHLLWEFGRPAETTS